MKQHSNQRDLHVVCSASDADSRIRSAKQAVLAMYILQRQQRSLIPPSERNFLRNVSTHLYWELAYDGIKWNRICICINCGEGKSPWDEGARHTRSVHGEAAEISVASVACALDPVRACCSEWWIGIRQAQLNWIHFKPQWARWRDLLILLSSDSLQPAGCWREIRRREFSLTS